MIRVREIREKTRNQEKETHDQRKDSRLEKCKKWKN